MTTAYRDASERLKLELAELEAERSTLDLHRPASADPTDVELKRRVVRAQQRAGRAESILPLPPAAL